LLEVLNKINTQTKEMFTETFNKIRDNFRLMFTEIFGGGKADLILTDENDVLEAASTSWQNLRASSCRASRCCPVVSRR
jgi:chromosome segregation ATPase